MRWQALQQGLTRVEEKVRPLEGMLLPAICKPLLSEEGAMTIRQQCTG